MAGTKQPKIGTEGIPDDAVLKQYGKKIEGVWLPKEEDHLVQWMTASKASFRNNGKITYQWQKQLAAMNYARRLIPGVTAKVFVDVGSHVGLWSMWWLKMMAGVVAYEPMKEFHPLFWANVLGNFDELDGSVPVTVRPFALLDAPGEATLQVDWANTGGTHLAWGAGLTASDDRRMARGEGAGSLQRPVPVTTLDHDLPTVLESMSGAGEVGAVPPEVGVIKIDCEGVELRVLLGARKIIDRYRPLIVVEQKRQEMYGITDSAADYLTREHGYSVLEIMSGDYIMAPAG